MESMLSLLRRRMGNTHNQSFGKSQCIYPKYVAAWPRLLGEWCMDVRGRAAVGKANNTSRLAF